MRSFNADGEARLLSWRHVREFAVPASMIETATARRHAGDWAGACAAAQVDVDLDLRVIASQRGREFAALVRADLRRLAPDLLRWHLPRTVSDGLLRPGLTISLTRYAGASLSRHAEASSSRHTGASLSRNAGVEDCAHLVVRTAPSWAKSGQRISLALWDPAAEDTGPHPRPRPDRRFRLDLHPHLWAADRAHELRERCGAEEFTHLPQSGSPAEASAGSGYTATRWTAEVPPGHEDTVPRWTTEVPPRHGDATPRWTTEIPARHGDATPRWTTEVPPRHGDATPRWVAEVPAGRGYAVHRWAAEAAILRVADGYSGLVAVRLGNGRRVLLPDTDPEAHSTPRRGGSGRGGEPVLPYAATWLPPDLELLRSGVITTDLLHPLVADALSFGQERTTTSSGHQPERTTVSPGHQPGGTTTSSGHQPERASAGSGIEPRRTTTASGDEPERTTAGTGAAAAAARMTTAGDEVRLVECCGTVHRVGLVDGRLVPLDHDPEELRREELLAVLGGPPMPCLRAIRTASRNPECLDEVRTRLIHGDHAGAAALVAELLGPDAKLEGALGEAFATAAEGRIEHGLYRAGLAARVPSGVTVPIGSRKGRHGRRGRHHRLPKRAALLH
jgi:hypothetical protein